MRGKKIKEPLRIAMFGHKRIPSREGGVEIVVEELCTRLVRDGHTVVCYNRAGHHVSGAEYDAKIKNQYKGIKLKTVPTIEKRDWQQLVLLFLRLYAVHLEDTT